MWREEVGDRGAEGREVGEERTYTTSGPLSPGVPALERQVLLIL